MIFDVIVVGAGAAGLMAAKTLVRENLTVAIVEAASIPGGRIRTIYHEDGELVLEAGAEFVHGNLPLTKNLFREANISMLPIRGKMIQVKRGKQVENQQESDQWGMLIDRIEKQETPITIRNFLDREFPGAEYSALRLAAEKFAQGFDLASIDEANLLGVKSEWLHNDEEQYHVGYGYAMLIDYLVACCKSGQVTLLFNHAIRRVDHHHDIIKVSTADTHLHCKQLLITCSAGVMRSNTIRFSPKLPAYAKAFSMLGFGAVIKFLFVLSKDLWKRIDQHASFFLSDEEIPTWWITRSSSHSKIMTGWIGGPPAKRLAQKNNKTLFDMAAASLASILHIPVDSLKEQIIQHEIFSWCNDPNIRGGYSFETMDTEHALSIFLQPIDQRIYFAGEALYTGEHKGTVEAALTSGLDVAQKIISKNRSAKK